MITPTSLTQRDAAQASRLAPMEEVRAGIWAIAQPVDRMFATLSYLIEDVHGDIHVVDPGMDSEEAWVLLIDSLRAIDRGVDHIASITVTHLHMDHIGMAERMRSASGAALAMHQVEQEAMQRGREVFDRPTLVGWGVPKERLPGLLQLNNRRRQTPETRADSLLAHGSDLRVPGRNIRVLFTPGHTQGHICLHLEDEGLILTGDHVLPHVSTGLGLGGDTQTNPLNDYLASLALVADLDEEAGPGHGFRFLGLPERVSEIAAGLRGRTEEIAGLLDAQTGLTLWEVARRVRWRGGFDALRGTRLINALTQTRMHVDYLERTTEVVDRYSKSARRDETTT